VKAPPEADAEARAVRAFVRNTARVQYGTLTTLAAALGIAPDLFGGGWAAGAREHGIKAAERAAARACGYMFAVTPRTE
jgi:hypothetical protein